MSIKKILANPRNRLKAGLLSGALVVSSVAILLAGTFSAATPVSFEQKPDEVGSAYILTKGKGNFSMSALNVNTTNENYAINDKITAVYANNRFEVTPEKAGATAIAYGSKINGRHDIFDLWVKDLDNVKEYTLIDGNHMSVPKNSNNKTIQITAKDGNDNDGLAQITWVSQNKDIADVDSATRKVLAGSKNGYALLVGSFTDIWGIQHDIPVMVTVGRPDSKLVEAPDGTYWYPGDQPNIWVEADEDGNVKIPPNYVYDKDETGPADGTNPSIPVDRGDDGGYYVQDPDYPNIWHEIDPDTGGKTGDSIWGGEDGKPGGGDDKPALQDPSKDLWWADLGQNVFDRVDPDDGTLAGDLTGGGLDSLPYTDPVQPIWYNEHDGKYYVGPLGPDEDNNYYYYGDKEGSTDGIQSSDTKLAPTDTIYYKDSDGNMTTTPPIAPSPQVTGVSLDVIKYGYTIGEGNKQFNATVSGHNLISGTGNTAVFWTVSPDKGASITQEGVFTATAEGTYIITVTAKDDTSKTAIATVTVYKSITDGGGQVGSNTLSDSQTGDGTWVEIATNGAYSLIVRASTIEGTYKSNDDYDDTNPARNAVNDWFNNKLSSDARLRDYTVKSNVMGRLGVWLVGNYAYGFSSPTVITAREGTDVAFLLSFQEAATYCSYQWYNGSAYINSTAKAKENWKKLDFLGDAGSTFTWLRTRGNTTSTNSVIVVSGHVYATPSDKLGGVRPALWVKSDIFNP